MVKHLRLMVLLCAICCVAAPVFAQTEPTQPVPAKPNSQRKDFYQLLKEAELKFTFPPGFKEVPAVNDEDFSFDFDMEIPGKDFEVWLNVRSQKENWTSYQNTRYDKQRSLANPDSLYIQVSKAFAKALTGDDSFLEKNIPPDVLARYNADAGKSYLLNLLDNDATRHYKYALIIALQKNHTGTLVTIYFTNQKNPDFYRNVNRASRCLKFKTLPPNAN